MTRDGLIEVMARALCVDDGVDPDVVGYDRTGSDFPNWYVVQGTAETVLSAIEAAGVRLVPSEATEEMVQAFFNETTRLRLTNYLEIIKEAYEPMLAASPYAPPKDESHE